MNGAACSAVAGVATPICARPASAVPRGARRHAHRLENIAALLAQLCAVLRRHQRASVIHRQRLPSPPRFEQPPAAAAAAAAAAACAIFRPRRRVELRRERARSRGHADRFVELSRSAQPASVAARCWRAIAVRAGHAPRAGRATRATRVAHRFFFYVFVAHRKFFTRAFFFSRPSRARRNGDDAR